MRKYFFWIIIILVVIFGATFGFHFFRNSMIARQLSKHESQHPVVSTLTVTKGSYQPVLPSVGSLVASQGIDLTSQTNGQVTKITFSSGAHIKKGDVLVHLDDRLALETYNKDKAILIYDKINYESQKALIKTNSTSQNDVDSAESTYLAQKAQVAQDKVNLDYTRIQAPFSGLLGIREVDIGEYITTSTPLVSLQQLNPMYVDFPMSSELLAKFSKGQAVNVIVSSQSKRTYTGKILAINSSVDESTRTVNVRASLNNDDESLLPGQFADVSVLLPVESSVIKIPRTAITYSLYGNAVLLVTKKTVDGKSQSIATETYVTTGDVDGDDVVILKGLSVGDIIVSSGQNKVTSGQVIDINNSFFSTDDAQSSNKSVAPQS